MKIKHITLKDYYRFKSVGIKEFSSSIEDDVVIIIGSNGSGKSSLMRELLPLTNYNNVYKKDTINKTLIIEKDDNEYTLIASVEDKKVTEYSFVKDDEELNPNMMFSSQNDLVEQYLMITPFISDILSNTFKITDASQQKRQEFFTKANPSDLNYLTSKYKDISSKRKQIQSNMKYLNTRKAELEADLISEEELIKLQNRLNDLKGRISKLNYIKEHMSTRTHELNDVDVSSITIYDPREVCYQLHRLSTSSEIKDLSYNDVSNKLSELNISKDYISKELNKYISDLAIQSSYYNEICDTLSTDTAMIDNLKLELDNLSAYMNNVDVDHKLIPLSDQSLMISDDTLSSIRDIILSVSDYYNAIPITHKNRTDIRDIRDVYSKDITDMKTSISIAESDIEKYDASIEELSIKLDEVLSPPDDCKRKDCRLLSDYTTIMNGYKLELKGLKNKRNDTYDILTKSNKKLDDMLFEYEYVDNCISKLSLLQDMLNKYIPDYNKVYKHTNMYVICDMYTTNIDGIRNCDSANMFNSLHTYIQKSREYVEYMKNKDKYEELKKSVDDLTSKSSKHVMLSKMKNNTKNIIVELESKISDSNKDILHTEEKICVYNKIINLLETYNTDRDKFMSYYTSLDSSIEKHFYETSVECISGFIDSLQHDMVEVSNLVNNQLMIKNRLEEEVLVELNKLDPKLKDIQSVESELLYLNYEYNIYFIQGILDNVNMILSKIFSYKIRVSNPVIDYMFKHDVSVSVAVSKVSPREIFNFGIEIEGNMITNDIHSCSTAQKYMCNLAFNISILISLGIVNYPLFLDEIDMGLDTTHRKRLFDFLSELKDSKLVSQLFIVSNTFFHDAFIGQIIVLDENNVSVPATYNEHTSIIK